MRGEMNFRSANVLVETVNRLLDENLKVLRLEMSGLVSVDSAGIGILVNIHQSVQGRGGEVVIENPTDRIVQILSIVHLDEVFQIQRGAPAPVVDERVEASDPAPAPEPGIRFREVAIDDGGAAASVRDVKRPLVAEEGIRTLGRDAVSVRLERDLDHHRADELYACYRELLRGGVRRIDLEFEQVDFVDSTGLAILVQIAQVLEQLGGRLALVGVKEDVRAVLRTTRLDQLIEVG